MSTSDVCLFDGNCDGQGACAKASPTTPCGKVPGDVECTETATGAEVNGALCTGAGSCNPTAPTIVCEGYAHCDGTECPTECASSADCVAE